MSLRQEMYKNFDRVENLIFNCIYGVTGLINRDFNRVLRNNRKYSNLYEGKRCFILGNGPSMNKYNDLNLLEEEFVFSVNQFYRSDLFEVVKPNFHVMVDPLFFSLDPDNANENDTLRRMKMLKNNSNLTCIFPYKAKEYVELNQISDKDTVYIHSRYRMHDNYNRKIRMDKNLPSIQNVVHAAIYCAIYMGFTEIYLMGCDMTGILTSFIKEDTERNIDKEHVYRYTEEEKKRMIKVRNDNNNEIMLKAYGITFEIFRNIYEYCDNNNIKIYNATIGGALDNIPRVKYEDIIRKESE